MTDSKYQTIGGVVTRGETFRKIIDLIDQLIDQSAIMAHLHNTEGNDMDKLLAKGWLGIVELFQLIRKKVVDLAMKKLQ